MDLIVFEGCNEVIVAPSGCLTNVIQTYFVDGGRDIEEYDVYTVDGDAGVSFTAGIKRDHADCVVDVDLEQLLPVATMDELLDRNPACSVEE